ncbi:MAG: hypothetical protein M5T61_09880 [Acidimicrobiia bacterium]|nr:hypothetical protein [Acidimicrobiia bacterium]
MNATKLIEKRSRSRTPCPHQATSTRRHWRRQEDEGRLLIKHNLTLAEAPGNADRLRRHVTRCPHAAEAWQHQLLASLA